MSQTLTETRDKDRAYTAKVNIDYLAGRLEQRLEELEKYNQHVSADSARELSKRIRNIADTAQRIYRTASDLED